MTSLCCEALRHTTGAFVSLSQLVGPCSESDQRPCPSLDPFSSHKPCKHTCSFDSRPAAGVSDAGLQAIAALSGLTHPNIA